LIFLVGSGSTSGLSFFFPIGLGRGVLSWSSSSRIDVPQAKRLQAVLYVLFPPAHHTSHFFFSPVIVDIANSEGGIRRASLLEIGSSGELLFFFPSDANFSPLYLT